MKYKVIMLNSENNYLANNVFTTQFSNEGMFYEIPSMQYVQLKGCKICEYNLYVIILNNY